ncbi:MAG: carboxypeptidase-like regulatory domain-containing protein [Bacteroidetes bacterium]|nr:carboxypeptidase-like regulatory domain-containing protein [Bacteroidota bacterium]
MRALKIVAVLLMVSVFTSILKAQTYTIRGKIFNSETKEPLPFVPVIIKGTTIGAQTDFDGNFVIKTTKMGDSLIATYVGYKRLARKINKTLTDQEINMPLVNEGLALEEVTVKAGENPAHRIIRNVIANKVKNNRDKLEAYEYETYNKIEFDLTRIPKEMQEKKALKPIRFVFDNVDSTFSGEKPSLPFFMIENISDFYFLKDPKRKREVVRASKITGIENTSISQVMGDMYQNINIYDNNILIFNKQFASPISNDGFFYYKYYLEDSLFLGNQWCYHIRFKPKRPQELSFTGNMWVADTTWGIKRLEMAMPKDANINFVNTANVVQEFSYEDSTWMLTKDRLVIDFAPQKKAVGFYGRKTTSYKKFILNKPRELKFYELGDKIDITEDATTKTDEFWQQNRHDSLSVREMKIYKMIDTIQTLPIYKTWIDIFYIFVAGYGKVNNFEIGPYYNLVSYNKVEGARLRFGGRTSRKFSRWYELGGYVAYGTLDKKWKYSLGFKSFITKKPHRQLVGMSFKSDYEILGQSTNGFSQDNIFASFFRTSPLTNLTRVDNTQAWYEREWFPGLITRFTLAGSLYTPIGAAKYQYYNKDGVLTDKENLRNTEARVNIRFAYKEKFVSGDFERVSLGTRYPVIQLNYAKSLQNAFGGEYDYQKLAVNLTDRVRITPILGYTDYMIQGGKIWGQVAYPLLELHGGNETYVYDYMAYNMMRYYEFGSDQYVAAAIIHHFEGLLFNKVPLLKKLKWREVVSGKAVWGTVEPRNAKTLIFPETLRSLEQGPYVEATAGIENIFKVFRVDALWRLTYPRANPIENFGFKFSFQLAL